ncbi:MAG: hypothetical protein M1831_005822 [Alyxoria varia]|nr:MAG: hypothetical protein M1831_005822 [Alyxoria varia]
MRGSLYLMSASTPTLRLKALICLKFEAFVESLELRSAGVEHGNWYEKLPPEEQKDHSLITVKLQDSDGLAGYNEFALGNTTATEDIDIDSIDTDAFESLLGNNNTTNLLKAAMG